MPKLEWPRLEIAETGVPNFGMQCCRELTDQQAEIRNVPFRDAALHLSEVYPQNQIVI